MSWERPKFTPDGLLNVSSMLGPWEQYERGSERWAEAVAAHLQHSVRRVVDDGDPVSVLIVLEEAILRDPHPWTVWPEEAKGSPEAWVRMVTGHGWDDVARLVTTRKGPKAWEPFAQALTKWEAEHRNPGAPKGNQNAAKGKQKTNGSDTSNCSEDRDHTQARGIRRRLQKRADAGDEQAAELVDQLSSCAITVNQAAIAAGMRRRYFRVPVSSDPDAMAAAIRRHLSEEQVNQLVAALTIDPTTTQP